MLRVSFSPAPEYVEADYWNRAFPTPPRHQERGCYCYCSCVEPLPSYLVAARFLKADYHYTTTIWLTAIGSTAKEQHTTLGPKFRCSNKIIITRRSVHRFEWFLMDLTNCFRSFRWARSQRRRSNSKTRLKCAAHNIWKTRTQRALRARFVLAISWIMFWIQHEFKAKLRAQNGAKGAKERPKLSQEGAKMSHATLNKYEQFMNN